MSQCPICNLDIPNQLPEFCSQCAWDIKNDPLFSVSLDRLPEKMLDEWQQRRDIQKQLWKERQRLEALREEQQFWSTCLERSDITAFSEYQQKYPDGAHIQEAKNQIQRIQHQQETDDEHQFWKDQCQKTGVTGYQSYLSKYPNGIYSDQAKMLIQQAERNKVENDLIEQDLAEWKKCRNENTISAIQHYIARHPEGRYANEARQILREFKQQYQHDKEALNEKNTSQEEIDWEECKRLRTLAAINDFRDRYPNSRFLPAAIQLHAEIYEELNRNRIDYNNQGAGNYQQNQNNHQNDTMPDWLQETIWGLVVLGVIILGCLWFFDNHPWLFGFVIFVIVCVIFSKK